MSLSPHSIEILLDVLEIKMGCMHVQDRDDAKELLKLRYCRQELLALQADARALCDKSKKNSGEVSRQALRVLKKRGQPA